MIFELDDQSVEIDFLSRQSQLSRNADRLSVRVGLGEPNCGLQVPLLISDLPENLNPGPAVEVLHDLQVSFQTLLVLFKPADLVL